MSFETRYARLNSSQKKAVDAIDGPVMIVAGPGTGKTELLSVRIANILKKTDTLPENILCLTFTESGQAAMRERLVEIIGKDAYKVAIHTFHSFGSEIISQNREYFYNNAQFEAADELKQYEIIRGIFEELPFSSPLASMQNGEYTHLRDALKTISELKRNSALTSDELRVVIDQNEAAIEYIEPLLQPTLEARVGKTTAAQLEATLPRIQEYASLQATLYGVQPLARVFAHSMEEALQQALDGSTKPITAWKRRHFEADSQKHQVFKDRKRLAKLKEIVHIYYQYLTRMEKAGLYDFDDMIMQVVHAIETQDDLRFNLQEKYLYMMVDEFQDTNLAQLRIINNLTDSPVHEGNPNILVVGDDDQAIYSFQGADISNILTFSDTYPDRTLVVLTDNYRSHGSILAASRTVITQNEDRLETRINDLSKELTAHKEGGGSVTLLEAPNLHTERQAIVANIVESIANGAAAHTHAVLARTHADIQSLLPYFTHAGVAVRYEHQENVLDTEPVQALIKISELVHALSSANHSVAEALLPEVLAHPAWNVKAADLWKLSVTAYKNRQQWMEVMATTPEFMAIHEWLVTRVQEAALLPLEQLLDTLMGTPEEGDPSPYYTYYFSAENLETNPRLYIDHLGALRAIRSKLRDYTQVDTPKLADFITFLSLYTSLGLRIAAFRDTVSTDTDAVHLMTAHKSKGLEFNTVYVFNGADSTWGQSVKSRSSSISYPENLPLTANSNTPDERLRLYYVAMTRAKSHLYLTFSTANDAEKATLRADFLVALDAPLQTVSATTDIQQETEAAEIAWHAHLSTPSTDLKTLLEPTLTSFKLSATALNSFLDVTRGGPRHFLLNNLLRFPSAKGAAAAYGTAIHGTLQRAHVHLKATGEQKPLEDILHDFEALLKAERLSEKDTLHYLEQGSAHISQFIQSGVLPMTPTQKAEVSFAAQGVQLDEAKLTGALDLIDIDEDNKTITVTDYKTGTPADTWEKGADYTKVKLHKYRQQLLFYKVLIESSGLYSGYTVTRGQLAFIQPDKAGRTILLDMDFTDRDEVERIRQLITKSWEKIMQLDLPDTSEYPETIAGILAFEDYLLTN